MKAPATKYKATQNFYHEAFGLADYIRDAFRKEHGVECVRTFSHPLKNGRKMKFWLVKDSASSIAAANQLVVRYDAILQPAGWSLGFQVINTSNYGTSITFKVTKMVM